MRERLTTETVGKRELDSFAPAVYLAFIRNEMFLYGRDLLAELIRYEASLEHAAIQAEVDKIIDRKSKPIPKDAAPEDLLRRIKQIQRESAALDKLWARQEELRGTMYPDTTPEAIAARRETR